MNIIPINTNYLDNSSMQLNANAQIIKDNLNTIIKNESETIVDDNNHPNYISVEQLDKINRARSLSINRRLGVSHSTHVVRENLGTTTATRGATIHFVNNNRDSGQIRKMRTVFNTGETEENNKETNCHHRLRNFMSHSMYFVIYGILTLFVLFGSDLKAAVLVPVYDIYFNAVYTFTIVLFILEIFLLYWANYSYRLSFFFWLDICATVSMLLEVDWFLIPVVNYVTLSSKISNDYQQVLINAKRNNRIGSVLRILRIIRLVRIVKLYKLAVFFQNKIDRMKKLKELRQKKQSIQEKKKHTIRMTEGLKRPAHDFKNSESFNKSSSIVPLKTNTIKDNDIINRLVERKNIYSSTLLQFTSKQQQISYEDIPSQSKISQVVSESITQKVIIVILLMLFLSPITDGALYSADKDPNYFVIVDQIESYYNYSSNLIDYNYTLSQLITCIDDDLPIINITVGPKLIYQNISQINQEYRLDELMQVVNFDGYISLFYSVRSLSVLDAILNIARTLFALLCLTLLAVQLARDSKKIILEPLEVMIRVVENVAKDPINTRLIESLEKDARRTIQKIVQDNNKKTNIKDDTVDSAMAQYEIQTIHLAIVKISALLAIGFGEAGGEIIKENITNSNDLNPMIEGKMRNAIFGFCDIRGFGDVNEALQERTMLFVNEIAEIVHSGVERFGGAANKNIGDAFLMVWKFKKMPQESINTTINTIDDPDETIINRTDPNIRFVADQAVLGFLYVIMKINKTPKILAYRHNEDILRKMKDKRFKVNMGFGLHMGWGVEGAIGSFHKIDASYLSPNVNIAARLEAATKQYGVSILISGQLYDLLSEDIKDICRLIDIVTVKGSVQPIKLYTIDLNLDLKPSKKMMKNMPMAEKKKYYNEKKKKMLKDYYKFGSLAQVVLNKKSFKELLGVKYRSEIFYKRFKEGFELYIDGEWKEAAEKFKECYYLDPSEGPSKTLFNYIKRNNYTKPSDWKGFRPLTSK